MTTGRANYCDKRVFTVTLTVRTKRKKERKKEKRQNNRPAIKNTGFLHLSFFTAQKSADRLTEI